MLIPPESSSRLSTFGRRSVENSTKCYTARGLNNMFHTLSYSAVDFGNQGPDPVLLKDLEEGIHYLTEAAKEIGVDPITEVARASHVDACLRAGFRQSLDRRTHDGKPFN